jgi:hypothetical protein
MMEDKSFEVLVEVPGGVLSMGHFRKLKAAVMRSNAVEFADHAPGTVELLSVRSTEDPKVLVAEFRVVPFSPLVRIDFWQALDLEDEDPDPIIVEGKQ